VTNVESAEFRLAGSADMFRLLKIKTYNFSLDWRACMSSPRLPAWFGRAPALSAACWPPRRPAPTLCRPPAGEPDPSADSPTNGSQSRQSRRRYLPRARPLCDRRCWVMWRQETAPATRRTRRPAGPAAAAPTLFRKLSNMYI
jgi:hypothetical protein